MILQVSGVPFVDASRPLQLRSYLEKLKTRSLRLQCFNRTSWGGKMGIQVVWCGCSGHDERSQAFSGQFITTSAEVTPNSGE